jgi:hypothetical protein
MSWWRRVFIAVGMVIGCAGCFGADYVVHPDPGFPAVLTTAAQAAAADWMSKVPVVITFSPLPCPDIREGGMICMHSVKSIPSDPFEPGTLSGFTIFTEMWLATPLLLANPPQYQQRLIAHEMGHAMGLLHTAAGSLMYPYSDGGALTVQQVDINQWYAVRHKPPVLETIAP